METKGIFRNIDLFIVIATTFLIAIGLINVYSAQGSDIQSGFFDPTTSFGKQMMWAGISLVVLITIFIIDARFFSNMAYIYYAITIALLAATLVIGNEVAGSKSWIIIGGFSLQPAELAKGATVLALAKYLDGHNINVSRFRDSILAFMIIFLPLGLVVLQNDFGSALVFIALIFVLFRQGLSPLYLIIPTVFAVLFIMVLLLNKFIVIGSIIFIASIVIWVLNIIKPKIMLMFLAGFVISIVLVIFLHSIVFIQVFIVLGVIGLFVTIAIWQSNKRLMVVLLFIGGLIVSVGFTYSVDYVFKNVLQPHHQSRILVTLGIEEDLRGAGYNVHQSKIAIGSGGLTGKGFLGGTQTKFNFIPEQTTDFIFCTVAEEYGLLGSTILILLFASLILRIIYLSENQKNRFTRLFGYGVASIIFFHFTVNLAMTLGLFPVIGIPLPFISYGGSSLLGFTIMIGLFLKFDSDFKHYFN